MPPGVVTTHTLFCVKTPLPPDGQHVLCALLNSLVANYLVRQRVTSHVTVGIVEQLPIPLPSPTSPACRDLAALAQHMATAPPDRVDSAGRLQAIVAHLYGLKLDDLDRVLATFPLIDNNEKLAIRGAFLSLVAS